MYQVPSVDLVAGYYNTELQLKGFQNNKRENVNLETIV